MHLYWFVRPGDPDSLWLVQVDADLFVIRYAGATAAEEATAFGHLGAHRHPSAGWDTSRSPGHLSGMVREMAMTVTIGATTVADAAAGDADALARIVAAHHDDMARIAFVICGDRDLAQDAVQSAWPLAWRKLGTLRQPDHLRSWLMAIAANEARRLLRSRSRERAVEIDLADSGTTLTDPAGHPNVTDLAMALRRLAPEDRALLAFRHVAGFDATEIGRALGMSPSGVRSRLARLLTRLRQELDHD